MCLRMHVPKTLYLDRIGLSFVRFVFSSSFALYSFAVFVITLKVHIELFYITLLVIDVHEYCKLIAELALLGNDVNFFLL